MASEVFIGCLASSPRRCWDLISTIESHLFWFEATAPSCLVIQQQAALPCWIALLSCRLCLQIYYDSFLKVPLSYCYPLIPGYCLLKRFRLQTLMVFKVSPIAHLVSQLAAAIQSHWASLWQLEQIWCLISNGPHSDFMEHFDLPSRGLGSTKSLSRCTSSQC